MSSCMQLMQTKIHNAQSSHVCYTYFKDKLGLHLATTAGTLCAVL